MTDPDIDDPVARQIRNMARGASLAAFGYDCERMLVNGAEPEQATEDRVISRMDELMKLRMFAGDARR
jgi:hypothetical protein